MSQRFGMADARCFTTNLPSSILNDSIATQAGVKVADGHAYRAFLTANADKLIQSMSVPSPDCIKFTGSS